MRNLIRRVCAAMCATLAFRGEVALAADDPNVGTVKAAWFEVDITPEVGARIVGYDRNDYSEAKYDELKAIGLGVDDGTNRAMIVSLDLIGMDYGCIKEIRRRLSRITGVPEGGVMVSCTHNHQGPATTSYLKSNANIGSRLFDETPGSADMRYKEFLLARLEKGARRMMERAWTPHMVGYYSQSCDENRNRRYTTSDNRASFIAHRPFLHGIADGIADKELGTVALLDESNRVAFVLGNYAAHPLTAHAPGLGGLRISSDYPGFYRRYIESETGATAMFLQGAAGDLVTKNDECGNAAARAVGEHLAMASIIGVISAQRCRGRYVLKRPRVGWEIRSFESPLVREYRDYLGTDRQTFDIQCVAIGDVCFVGVPGEVVTELGLEIKWNSPFARTYIAYLATGYSGYIVPANLRAAGGYESQSQRFACRDTLTLVKTAADAMFDLRARLFPEDNAGDDPYPDNLRSPLVNVPEMYKEGKHDR